MTHRSVKKITFRVPTYQEFRLNTVEKKQDDYFHDHFGIDNFVVAWAIVKISLCLKPNHQIHLKFSEYKLKKISVRTLIKG